MARQMASNQWIYNTFKVGNNDSRMPTKSVIEGYGLKVSGSYASNQLVARDDISEGLVDIPFYVVLNWHQVPYNSRRIFYNGSYRYPQYFSLWTNYWGAESTVTMAGGNAYPVYMDTFYNSAGDNQYLNFDSSGTTLQYPVSVNAPQFNRFAIPAGINIEGVYIQDIYINWYEQDKTPIGLSGSVTTNFGYRLSLAFNYRGWWEVLGSNVWTNQYGHRITGSMVGYSDRYVLHTGTGLSTSYSLNSNTLTSSSAVRGVAIMFDFYEIDGGGGNSSW